MQPDERPSPAPHEGVKNSGRRTIKAKTWWAAPPPVVGRMEGRLPVDFLRCVDGFDDLQQLALDRLVAARSPGHFQIEPVRCRHSR